MMQQLETPLITRLLDLSKDSTFEQLERQHELMLKYGPKDVCYAANWQPQDLIHIQKMCARKIESEIDHFYKQQEKRWNDHINTVLELGNAHIPVEEVSKAGDIVTIQGLQFCCRQIINSGLASWRYHGVGNSTIEARTYQQRLYGETEPRADMTQAPQGSITRVSQNIRAIGIFPSTFPTITVRESAVFNVVSGYTGTMLNRQGFSTNPITHTVNVSPFTVATDITFASVTTYG